MQQVNIDDAQSQFTRLIEEAESGNEIIIARAGKPVVRLVRCEDVAQETGKRKGGQWKGKVWMSDDFDAPLPPDIQEAFEGKRP